MKFVAAVRFLSSGHNRTLGVFNSLDMARKCSKTLVPARHPIVPPSLIGTAMGKRSLLSPDQMRNARPTCFILLTQLILRHLLHPDRDISAGSKTRKRMASVNRSTSNSTTEKARWRLVVREV